MTAPIQPTTLPDSLGRVLSPEEFMQARGMTPTALQSAKFPQIPPVAQDATHAGPADPNPNAKPLTGLPRILTQYVAEPILDHPIATIMTAGIPGGTLVAGGLMAKDIAEYAGQKAAELQMTPEQRKVAEADPNRIPGERAAVEAVMLGAAPLVKGVFGRLGETINRVRGKAPTDLLEPTTPAADVGATVDATATPATPVDEGTPPPSPPVPAQAAIQGHVARVTDAWKTMFSPATRSPEALQAANILRATTGEMAANYEQAAYKLDEFRRAIEPLPESDKLGFIDAIEGGRSQPSPEFQEAANTIRTILDNAREDIQNLGTGKLDNFIENYFPHIWTDPDRAADAFAIMGGKRPMEGPKAFLKARTIPTTLEGMELGLTPVSTNPVDLTLLKLREMQRYVMAHQSLSEMQDAGLVKLVRAGDIAPDGYARIDDNVATVFGPRQGAVSLPADANIAPEDVGVPGRRIMGQYWAPEPVARVVNNYLSPGLRGNALYDAYRGAGNTLNQAQLGLSAFHLMFTSMDASVSRAALGLEYIASGKPIEGLSELASAPVAPVTNLRLGARIRSAYLNPEGASPDMLALANAVKEAGGRVRQDSFYQNSAPERMIAAWRAGEYGKATALSLPALFEYAAKPIMEHIVPLQKLGVFGDLAQKALADLPPEASLAERRAALSDAWDSVDNRMGQLVYDNLFWNKTFKDLAMASVRSVGWNIGTIRELGGGLLDAGKMAGDAAKGNEVALTHRAAYVMALPITVGLYGALYQYLRTGQAPSELKDYFYPRTGDTDPDGNPERVQIASYMKDFFAYRNHPWETVQHKMSPILSTVYEMLQNEDYYGDEIRNPHDPLVTQVAQEAKYMGEQVMPFSWRNMQEGSARGDMSTATKLGNWFGITPAPRDVVRSDAQNLMAEFLAERGMSGATPEDAEARQTRAQILSALRGHSDIDLNAAVTDAIERHQLTSPQLAQLLKRAGTTPAQERFKRLTAAQAIEVFKRSTPREKALFAEALIAKVERMSASNDMPISTDESDEGP